jgi:hypothetical protein
MFTAAAAMFQEVLTELSGAESEADGILAITKIVLKLANKMAARFHRPLNFMAFNMNSIVMQHYELSKQLRKSHIHGPAPKHV